MNKSVKSLICWMFCIVVPMGAAPANGQVSSAGQSVPSAVSWLSEYADALNRAKAEQKMLFVYFQPSVPDFNSMQVDQLCSADSRVVSQLANMVCLRTSVDARTRVGDQEMRLVDHAAFGELAGGTGVILLDFAHPGQNYYGYMVSALPFASGKYYRFQPSYLGVMLDLPPGTITQRTMVFAVRIHPMNPASTQGMNLPLLSAEAGSHSGHQAQIQVQGHHNWGQRFQRLTASLPGGLHAREVCAESWPNENMMDAAIDCVDCWRQSPGHWSAVSASHPHYGYDMQRGSNGIWYATGVFGTYQN